MIVGVLPGFGPAAAVSLLIPVTFGLDATTAIIMLAAILYGAAYGGTTTAVLLRSSRPAEACRYEASRAKSVATEGA